MSLLVIDDSATFRERITLVGEGRDWVVLASDDQTVIEDWLAGHSPDVILLDWQLPGRHRRDYAELLNRHGLTGRTLLLSTSEMDDKRRRFIEEHGLAGYRLKPLDLDRFEDEIRLPTQAKPWPGLEKKADEVDVAIDILDKDLNPLWSNVVARFDRLTLPQRLIVKLLRAELSESRQQAARRLDWDGDKKRFLESRLFALKSGDYWLARDWRDQEDRPHDHELLNLEKSTRLDDWLRAVARLLAQRYAISRFRVYKIAPLPHVRELEQSHGALVMPLFQAGGGFRTDADTWLRSGFLADENPNTRRALASDFQPRPERVDDGNPNRGCREIEYGRSGTDRVQFPVRGTDGQALALFALDRRLDHAGTLTGFDREVVEIARRMASDDAGPLRDLQWGLMKGLVEDIGERLIKRLKDDESCRETDWHEAISKALQYTFAEPGRSPEMTYEGLSQVCGELVRAWAKNEISGRIMGVTEGEQAIEHSESPPISTWYVALMTDETHWQAVAGVGETSPFKVPTN